MKYLTMTKFSESDKIIMNPLSFFLTERLKEMEPYSVFTGIGVKCVIMEEHECDCEYCTHDNEPQEYTYVSKEEMKKYHDSDDIVSVKEIFFAKIVQQNYEDIFGVKS